MRYMVFVKMNEDVGDAPPALVEAMSSEMSGAFADGSMVAAGGLYPLSQSTEIRLSDGVATVVDGPFAEAKEVVGGFSILETRNHQEAVESARRVITLHQKHWPTWQGSVEVRRIAGPEQEG